MNFEKKAAFIIPYFGKLPDYFSEWVYTASYLEKNVDFLIMTDDKDVAGWALPSNIKIIPMTFDDLKKRIQEKFDFEICLDYPYKLCDYKPAYGFIFEDFLENYEFWGYCDIDQIWGNFVGFIEDEILNNFEKVLHLGHFSLYKNNEKMRKLFMKEGSFASYKEIFSNAPIYGFDEFAGLVRICKLNNIKVYFKQIYADIDVRYNRVKLRHLPNYKKQIVYWKNGDVLRSFIDNNGVVITEKYLYAHFQKKHPVSINAFENKPSAFIVNAKQFIDISGEEITPQMIEKYCDFVDDKTDEKEKKLYMKNKVLDFLKAPVSKKILWIRMKKYSENIYNS